MGKSKNAIIFYLSFAHSTKNNKNFKKTNKNNKNK